MRILLFFTISATVVAIGESVACYNCVEMPEDSSEVGIPGAQKCIKPFSPNDKSPRCTTEGFCMKGTGTMDGLTVTMRQCVPVGNVPNHDSKHIPAPKEPIEMQLGPVKVTAHLCDTDLCNSASILTVTSSLAILLLTTLFIV